MTSYLTFLVLGLSSGAMFAGLALGVMVVFKASGVVNFAQGAMSVWGAYVAFRMARTGELVFPIGTIDLGAPQALPFAIVIGLISGVGLSAVSYYLVFRPLRHAPALAQVVASIGMMLLLQALVVLRFGSAAISVDPIFGDGNLDLAGVRIPVQTLILVAVVVLLGGGLAAVFRFSRIGLAIRAASEDERAAVLTGFNPSRLAAFAWMTSGLLCTLVVILSAPQTGLNPTIFTLAIIPALGALLVGKFDSITMTIAAALALGGIQGVLTYSTIQPWWPNWAKSGVATTLPFLIIVVLLYFRSDRVPQRGTQLMAKLPPVPRPNIRPLTVLSWVAVGCAVMVLLQGSYRFGFITSLILALLSLSFVVLTGYLGQVSLAQAALAGSAGFLLSRLGAWWGGLFPIDLIVASLVAAGVGVLVAIPALRLRGTQLAIVTMAAAVAVEAFIFSNPAFTPREGNPIVSPSLFGIDLGIRSGTNVARLQFGLLVLGILAIAAVSLGRILGGRTGRAFLAVRSNEKAAAAIGIHVPLAKVMGFGMSSFIAGVGGCLLGYTRGQLSVDSFTIFVGVSLLAFAYLGGITSISGAVVAGVLGPLGLLYVVLDRAVELGTYYAIVSGLGLVVTSVLNPHGIAGAFSMLVKSRKRGPGKGSTPTGSEPVEEAEVARHG